MSRSYKKTSVFKDEVCRKTKHRYRAKTLANRAVRRVCVPSGKGGFKKVYNSWDISDYRIYQTEAEFRQEWENGAEYLHKSFKNYKQALWYWKKWHRAK